MLGYRPKHVNSLKQVEAMHQWSEFQDRLVLENVVRKVTASDWKSNWTSGWPG